MRFATRVFWIHRHECARAPLPPLPACHFLHADAPGLACPCAVPGDRRQRDSLDCRAGTAGARGEDPRRAADAAGRGGEVLRDTRLHACLAASRGYYCPAEGDPRHRRRRADAGRLPPGGADGDARRPHQSGDAADRRRAASADGGRRGVDDRPRALRAGPAGGARQALERRSARRRAAARCHARSTRPFGVDRHRDRRAEAESLHLHRPQAGAGPRPRPCRGRRLAGGATGSVAEAGRQRSARALRSAGAWPRPASCPPRRRPTIACTAPISRPR